MTDYKDLNDYEIMYMIAENDDSAKKVLIEKYYPLINKMAKTYHNLSKGYGLDMDDFIQEGYFALFSAIKNYSENRNCLFYTYASLSIKTKMINLIEKNRNSKNLALNTSISLNAEINNNGETLFIDLIPDKNALLPNLEAERREIERVLNDLIFDLDIIKGSVLELKLNGFTNRNIAQLLGIAQKTVSNTLVKIKKNLSLLIEKTNY